MIYLDKIQHKEYDFNEGTLVKKLIVLNNQKYIFKANNGFPYMETPSSVGEVLYSKVASLVHSNCVKAQFAELTIDGKVSKGVLIKHFCTSDVVESLTFGQILGILDRQNIKIKMDTTVPNILNLVGAYARYLGLKFDYDEVALDLNKMAILDYFFSQRDRHYDNIEFLITKDEMKLAPMYDNGFCFNFTKHQSRLEANKESNSNNGTVQLLKLQPLKREEPEQFNKNFAHQIAELIKEDKEIKDFVRSVVNLNIVSILDEVYMEAGTVYPRIYMTECKEIFDNRVNVLKSELQHETVKESTNTPCLFR